MYKLRYYLSLEITDNFVQYYSLFWHWFTKSKVWVKYQHNVPWKWERCPVWNAVWITHVNGVVLLKRLSLKASCLGQCCLHQNSVRGFGAYTKRKLFSFWTDTQVHMNVIKSLNKNLHNKVVLKSSKGMLFLSQ